MVLSVSLSLSVDSQLSDLIVIQNFLYYRYQEGLNLFLQWFVLNLFAFDVLVCCFHTCFGNRGNGCCSYAGIWNSSFVDCYSLSYSLVSNCCWVFDSLICCLNYFLICCLDNVDFDCLNSF